MEKLINGEVSDPRVRLFSAAVWITVWGNLMLAVVVAGVYRFDLFDFPFPWVFGLIVFTLSVHLLLLAAKRHLIGLNWFPYAYQLLNVLTMTAAVHFFGGIEFTGFILMYALLVLLAEMWGTKALTFVTANASAVCYGGLALLEHTGVLNHYSLFDIEVPVGVQIGLVGFMWVALNLLCFYVRHSSAMLKSVNRDLGEANRMVNRYSGELVERARELEQRNITLEMARDELQQKNLELDKRNQEIEDFVSIVHHDLNNPVLNIAGYADLLRVQLGEQLSGEEAGYVEAIQADTQRIMRMLKNLLQIARATRDTDIARAIPLGDFVSEIISDFRCAPNGRLIRFIYENLPTIHGKEKHLSHIFRNIIGNASKYVGDKEEARVMIGCTEGQRYYEFYIRDNGVGVARSQHERVFRLFGRGTNQVVAGVEQSGSGIGLAIVKRIIERLRGQIWFESELGKGTTFYFTIPKRPLEEEPSS